MTTEAKEKYTVEFNENAVKRANESSNIAETAHELGIKANTLYNWVYQYSHRILCSVLSVSRSASCVDKSGRKSQSQAR